MLIIMSEGVEKIYFPLPVDLKIKISSFYNIKNTRSNKKGEINEMLR